MKRKKLIFYFYDRLQDPLLKSGILIYIDELVKNHPDSYQIALITYEDGKYEPTEAEKKVLRETFKASNIDWFPISKKPGNGIKNSLVDLLKGFFMLIKLSWFKGYRSVTTLGTIAGSFAYLAVIFAPLNLFLYQYEPHSKFAMEVEGTQKKSLKNRIFAFLENRSAKKAKVIASGTKHMVNELKKLGVKASVFRIPSAVDESRFFYDEQARTEIRRQLNIPEERKVLIYVGKFGGIYYSGEIFELFETIYEHDPNTFLLVLSPMEREELISMMKGSNIPESAFYIGFSEYGNIYKYLSASDLGIVAVPPTPSQKYRSPIKTGEYLCCGLPYIVCKGISEDDDYAIENKVGVVVSDFSKAEITAKMDEISSFLYSEKADIHSRCRESGIAYRSFKKLNPLFEEAILMLTN